MERVEEIRVNMYRKAAGSPNGINETNETMAMRLIHENPAITQKEMKEKMGVSLVTIKRLMADLQKSGKVKRQGSSRSGMWMIVDPDEA